eukprot:CAMPEP_0114117208 /NCGR_PEP_ID=MMETSP0043_2-20121206/4912_1 /TAXON_ID=464988 /ORGANISM="Hemiselmis andersenii, Strain CCMP644" /LENGTH=151 /DNA_ID=CAMNT_0001209587 /DNA_START=256 /DNA_END=708 /DNA_ORIENTATION=-
MALITDAGDMIYSGKDPLPEHQVAVDVGGVRYVASGYKHSLLLTEAGVLYSTGSNTYGQLGHTGDGHEDTARPVVAVSDRKVGAVACGKHHSMCLVEGGDVYCWGCGSDGQTGTGRMETVMVPRFVKGLHGMEAVSLEPSTSTIKTTPFLG